MPRHVLDIGEETRALGQVKHDLLGLAIIAAIVILCIVMYLAAS